VVALLPIVIYLYVNDASATWYLLTLLPTLLILSPVIFHYARVLWLHIDEVLDPRREGE
jgi:hypothetical protein